MSQNIEAAQILDNAPKPTEGSEPATEGGGIAQAAPPPEKVSGKLEILIKREQAALFRERLARQKEAEIEAKLKALTERESKLQEFEGAKGNPNEALKALGLSYDEITRAQLQDGQLPPEVHIRKIEEKFDAFKSAKEQEDQRRGEEQKRLAQEQEQRAITNFKTEIGTFVKDNKDRYEYITFEGQEELIFDVVDEHYNRTMNPDTGIGKVMPIKDAADKVELFLEKKYNQAKELPKTKALWGAVPKPAIQNAVKPESNQRSPQPSRTLTNNLTARPQTPTTNRMITDEERVQKAIALGKAYLEGRRA